MLMTYTWVFLLTHFRPILSEGNFFGAVIDIFAKIYIHPARRHTLVSQWHANETIKSIKYQIHLGELVLTYVD